MDIKKMSLEEIEQDLLKNNTKKQLAALIIASADKCNQAQLDVEAAKNDRFQIELLFQDLNSLISRREIGIKYAEQFVLHSITLSDLEREDQDKEGSHSSVAELALYNAYSLLRDIIKDTCSARSK